MIARIASFFFGCLVCSGAIAGQAQVGVVGSWVCGPYEIDDGGVAVTVVERSTYAGDGGFIMAGSGTIRLPGGQEVSVETRHTGHWVLNGDVLRITFSGAELLSSSSELFPVEVGQARLDSGLARKNWNEKRVLESGERLVTSGLNVEPGRAPLEVSCARA